MGNISRHSTVLKAKSYRSLQSQNDKNVKLGCPNSPKHAKRNVTKDRSTTTGKRQQPQLQLQQHCHHNNENVQATLGLGMGQVTPSALPARCQISPERSQPLRVRGCSWMWDTTNSPGLVAVLSVSNQEHPKRMQ